MIPGADGVATGMMKKLISKKGVASIEDLREAAVDSDVTMIACQMTMDLFEYKLDDLIEGPESVWEAGPLEQLARSGELMSYQHDGFWQPMDTLRDKIQLDELWKTGSAPWKRW